MELDTRTKFKCYLLCKGITQKALADKCGIHKARLNSYLNGILNMPENQVKAMCEAAGVKYKSYINGRVVGVKQ